MLLPVLFALFLLLFDHHAFCHPPSFYPAGNLMEVPSRQGTPILRLERAAGTEGSQSSLTNSPFPLEVRQEKAIDGFFDLSTLMMTDSTSLLAKSKTIIGVIDENDVLVRWEGVVDYVIEDAAPKVGDNMIDFWAKFDDILVMYKKFKKQCITAEDDIECTAERVISAGASNYHFYFRGSNKRITVLRIIELATYAKEQANIQKENEDLETFKNSIVSAMSHKHITPLSVLDASRGGIKEEMNHLRMALNVLYETIESFMQSQIALFQTEGDMALLQEVLKARNALQESNKRIDKFDKKFILHLRTIASQTSELRQTTLAMLAYSDICGNKFNIRMKDKLNLIDLCHEAHAVFSASAMSKGVEFETHMDAGQFNPYVQIDAERFKQALYALLYNSVQFSHENGQPIRFDFVMDEQNEICFTVRDYGCGISQANLPLVCKPFFAHNPMGDTKYDQSLGLGLFLARTFIEAMNGRLEIESEEGVSTRGRIILPFKHIATHRSQLHSLRPENTVQGQSMGKGPQIDPNRRRSHHQVAPSVASHDSSEVAPMYNTVIISEDNRVTGALLRKFITRLGYKAELYETGTLALKRLQQAPTTFFAACLDYNIPADVPLTGADIAIKMKIVAPMLPIIIITANLNPNIQQGIETAKVDQFMSKPFDQKRLTELLKTYYENIHVSHH